MMSAGRCDPWSSVIPVTSAVRWWARPSFVMPIGRGWPSNGIDPSQRAVTANAATSPTAMIAAAMSVTARRRAGRAVPRRKVPCCARCRYPKMRGGASKYACMWCCPEPARLEARRCFTAAVRSGWRIRLDARGGCPGSRRLGVQRCSATQASIILRPMLIGGGMVGRSSAANQSASAISFSWRTRSPEA